MKRRLLAGVLTPVMCGTMAMTAFAATVTEEDANPTTKQVDILTSIAPSYTVTIPENATVDFMKTETTFGVVKLEAAQINPDKKVVVSLNASGTLKNQTDTTKLLPYEIQTEGEKFVSVDFTEAGEEADLVICITTQDWEDAFAGDYKDTVEFTVSYADR